MRVSLYHVVPCFVNSDDTHVTYASTSKVMQCSPTQALIIGQEEQAEVFSLALLQDWELLEVLLSEGWAGALLSPNLHLGVLRWVCLGLSAAQMEASQAYLSCGLVCHCFGDCRNVSMQSVSHDCQDIEVQCARSMLRSKGGHVRVINRQNAMHYTNLCGPVVAGLIN